MTPPLTVDTVLVQYEYRTRQRGRTSTSIMDYLRDCNDAFPSCVKIFIGPSVSRPPP